MIQETNIDSPADPRDLRVDDPDLLDLLTVMVARWRLLLWAPLAAGLAVFGLTYLIAPTFTAETTFLPPQQQQSAAASALASLGALSSLAGGAGVIKSPADQYVSLMRSATVEDRIIDRFKLMDVYEAKYRYEARRELEKRVHISLGKKDGLISVAVEAESRQLAADMANQHVAELRRISSELALTEAQQRRAFFEAEVKKTHDKLVAAQQALQSNGFNPGALKAEPKAAADTYAVMKAQATAAEVRLQTLRRSRSDSSAEVQQELATLEALNTQLSKIESPSTTQGDADYLGRYREFKYQEALFETFSKQFELARIDESREGSLAQVVDVAMPPERASGPRHLMSGAAAVIATFMLLVGVTMVRHFWREASKDPRRAEKVNRLKTVWRDN